MLKEQQLIQIAEQHPDDDIAERAMKVLRVRYNDSYFWCIDCDGLVCKKSECCLNQKSEPVDFTKIF